MNYYCFIDSNTSIVISAAVAIKAIILIVTISIKEPFSKEKVIINKGYYIKVVKIVNFTGVDNKVFINAITVIVIVS